jgi:hypothetical protein
MFLLIVTVCRTSFPGKYVPFDFFLFAFEWKVAHGENCCSWTRHVGWEIVNT